jgi:NADPH:quinone reductase-like Zn-dependent oxidoreductase
MTGWRTLPSADSALRAFVLRGHGDLGQAVLAEVPAPVVRGERDVLIRLRAAALNHLDLWTVRGLPGLTLRFPHVLGGDGAGEVEAVGTGVRSVTPGQRVMINPGIACYACDYCEAGEHSLCVAYRLLGEHLPGTLAEYVVVPDLNVAVIPTPPGPHPEITWAEAAAFTLVTLTAWRMLVTRARVRPGEVVLLWGVGGGVASTALRIAKLMGAYVIVTSSSDEKLDVARSLGADATLNHSRVDVPREVRSLTGKRGADVVVDDVGEATWEQSLRALARQGRLVTCGATTGPRVVTDARRLFWHHYTIMGSTMGNLAEFREIVRVLGQGRLRPLVDSSFTLEDAGKALERLSAGRQMGKVVVEI